MISNITSNPAIIKNAKIKTEENPLFDPKEIEKFYKSLTKEEKESLAKGMFFFPGKFIPGKPGEFIPEKDYKIKDLVKALMSPSPVPIDGLGVQLQLVELLKKDGYQVQFRRPTLQD